MFEEMVICGDCEKCGKINYCNSCQQNYKRNSILNNPKWDKRKIYV